MSEMHFVSIPMVYFLLFVLYGLSFALELRNFLQKKTRSSGDLLFELGFLVHTIYIFAEAKDIQFYLPVTTVREVLIFFAWSLAFIYTVMLRRLKHGSFGLILIPFLFLCLSSVFFMHNDRAIPTAYFNSSYFLVHILSAFFAYASFTISFAASVLYLVESKMLKSKRFGNWYYGLPPLQELEVFIFHSIAWGICLLIVGISSGFFWSRTQFHTFFIGEPKALASIVTLLVYSGIFILHRASQLGSRRSVLLVFFAFGLVLFTFLGTSLLPGKVHVGLG